MQKILLPFLMIILFQAVGATNGVLTQGGMGWYDTLNKSPLTPPDWAFPVAWATLYVLMGLAAAFLICLKDKRVLALFTALTLLNWSWSYLFFTAQMTGVSALSIVIQNILTLAIILLVWGKDRRVSYCLIPLLLWTSFATYLNGYIWLYN